MPLDPKCRACGRRVSWARRALDGRLTMFDADPSEAGRYDLREQPDGSTVAVEDEAASPAFARHSETCPSLDLHPSRG